MCITGSLQRIAQLVAIETRPAQDIAQRIGAAGLQQGVDRLSVQPLQRAPSGGFDHFRRFGIIQCLEARRGTGLEREAP